MSKELNNSTKILIYIQNTDNNKRLKWCLVRYLHLEDKNVTRIKKIDKDLVRKLDLKHIKFPVKITDIHKTKKKMYQH